MFFTFTSICLFCPDYFENFLSTFDAWISTENDTWRYIRDILDLSMGLIVLNILALQVFIDIFTYNPIVLGLRAGEILG